MLLSWTVTWVTLCENARSRKASRLDDPLDAGEWQPFRWAVPLIALLLRQHSPTDRPDPVENAGRKTLSWSRSRAG
nr:hypothetical protein RKHAN_02276 [Rhizobium sp. Khangiran2]